MAKGTFYVYIAVDSWGAFQVGLTNDLTARLLEHRRIEASRTVLRLEPARLLYFEEIPSLSAAVQRERQLRTLPRGRKKWLVNRVNPEWRDLLEA